MKKLTIFLAAVALVCFSVPAMAVDWNFFGSARMATFWVDSDFGDGANAAGTDDKDADLRWDLQGNSRIGARVKADPVDGYVELGLKGNGNGDLDVGTRRIFGTWDFGAGELKVGKDYTPISQFISGQVFDEDLGLLGIGTMYGNRIGQIALSFGGFEVALIQPRSSDIETIGGVPAGGDVDEYLPRIEAKWGMAFDAFNFAIRGGAQTYEIEDIATVNGTEDVDVTTYAIGADGGFNFGPGYVKGAASWTRNAAAANWHLPGIRNAAYPVFWDGGDDTEDTDTIMAALVVGLKVSDMLSFEAGGGWRQDDADVDGADKDEAWEAYVQAVVGLAPGVYIIPEIGYTDLMDDVFGDDEGDAWYAGAKWQIDF